MPTVSVVIPTAQRPKLLMRAVESALAQDFVDIEVIVVVDGSEPGTVEALSEIEDSRLCIIETGVRRGGGHARNVGVAHARSEWIAFLDDDDEWMHHKLTRQYRVATEMGVRYPVVAARLIARTPRQDYIWPRRLIGIDEPIADYLFARSTLFQGEGLIQTSTIFTSRELLERVPFRDLPRHQDWDWLLRVGDHEGVRFMVIDEPLAIWYREERRATVSGQLDWRFSFSWAHDQRALFTSRAYAAFLLTVVGSLAARKGAWRAGTDIVREAVRNGKPSLLDWMLFAGMWVVPRALRRTLRRILGVRRSFVPASSTK